MLKFAAPSTLPEAGLKVTALVLESVFLIDTIAFAAAVGDVTVNAAELALAST